MRRAPPRSPDAKSETTVLRHVGEQCLPGVRGRQPPSSRGAARVEGPHRGREPYGGRKRVVSGVNP